MFNNLSNQKMTKKGNKKMLSDQIRHRTRRSEYKIKEKMPNFK